MFKLFGKKQPNFFFSLVAKIKQTFMVIGIFSQMKVFWGLKMEVKDAFNQTRIFMPLADMKLM